MYKSKIFFRHYQFLIHLFAIMNERETCIMKKSILQPMISDESVIVQFTDTVVFDKTMAVMVPNGYIAFVFADEKAQFRIEPCSEKKIVNYGKELRGKNGKVAFVRTKPLPSMAWGFGNIQVNNERLKEAYRVGANGKYNVELVQPTKLISRFDVGEDITTEKLRERTISLVKNIGVSLLGKYFAGTEISVFEIASCTNDFRAKFLAALQSESVFSEMGLALKDLTVDGIHVPEEDIESIRSRINAPEKKEDTAGEGLLKVQEKFVADLSKKLDERFEQLREQLYAKQDEAPDISGQIRSMREELAEELSERLGDKMQEMQETIADGLDERLQELLPLKEQAKEEYLKTLKVTAEFLIDHAADEHELASAAGMIYTKVEENLIKTFHVRYENKKFVMGYDDYRSLVTEVPGLLSKYDVISPTILQEDEYGGPKTVEMLPQVRFYEAGLNVADSLTARDYWCFLNKLRHKSPENDAFLRRKFLNFSQEKKYLASALGFFKAHGLYTKE